MTLLSTTPLNVTSPTSSTLTISRPRHPTKHDHNYYNSAPMATANTSIGSPDSREDTIRLWINPETGKHNFSRCNDENLELRTVAGVELFRAGYYKNLAVASRDLKVSYWRLYSRHKGSHPRQKNGGNHTLFSKEEEGAIIIWAHRRITHGHHITIRALCQHANAVLRAKERPPTASRKWARHFMRSWKHTFHKRKSTTRDAKRKAMEDRGEVEKWFKAWREYMRYVNPENVWNVDEIGFMIGYLLKGTFLWTFAEIERPILTDAHELCSMTAIEAISAAGKSIAPFLIMPGVQLPFRWFDNNLDGDTSIATSPRGYITDILASEWIEHFERLTRPSNPGEKRVILLDGCESHFTKELAVHAKQHNIEIFPFPPHLTHMLQPLDVGVFSSYKHWQQDVLYREIADGATDFNKSDFLFHLQEIRDRTFKKSTIISAWEKCGIYPFNPSVVLDQMVDPLSSLSQEVNEQDLPGFVTLGDTSESDFDGSDDDENAPEDDSDDQEFQEIPITPKTPEKINWATVATPPFNIRIIQRYQEYVALRIEASIVSGVRLTPSVAHVHEKSRKATEVLMINGITSTEEMKRLKEKNLRRRALQQGTQIVSNYGPIRVSDARLRVAKDEYHRRAAQAEEYRRYRKKEATDEVKYIYRWIKDVRSIVRVSVNNISGVEARRGLWAKAARRELLSSNEDMSKRYAIQREFRESFALSLERITGITWPPDYDEETVTSAVKFVALEEQERRAAKKLLTYEADGIEIIVEDCIEVSQGEFTVPKEEPE